jgi:hypothetical protein
MVYGCACAATVMVLIAIHSNQEKKDFTFWGNYDIIIIVS